MSFTLQSVVPWGRSFDEYRAMFYLSEADLGRRVLGCGDGPAAFNAEATRLGARVVSCDPLYRFSAAEIAQRIEATRDEVLEQVRQNRSGFVWRRFGSVEHLGETRLRAMRTFLEDYERGAAEGRYVDAELPTLPWPDGAFGLALCSHLLFLYSDRFGADFHVQSITELCRVAGETRVFPLVGLDGQTPPFLDEVLTRLGSAGLVASVERVGYEFQRGADKMLRVHAPTADV